MSEPFVALVTATQTAKEDFDMPPLLAALGRTGVPARVLAWDDPGAQGGFAAARACVIRSTWNYVQNLDAFLRWVDRTPRLWNPAPVVRWNIHKRYLLELEQQGIPVIPTHLVMAGSAACLADLAAAWPAVVIKPAISAGSLGTIRVATSPEGLAAGQAHLDNLGGTRDMLVQRYMPAVEGPGERSLVWMDGALSHAARKSPRFSGDQENVSSVAVPIAPDEAALAEAVLALAPGPRLYARVDMVRGDDGRPRLMELELIEPSLFLSRAEGAADRFAAAVRRVVETD